MTCFSNRMVNMLAVTRSGWIHGVAFSWVYFVLQWMQRWNLKMLSSCAHSE